MPERTGRKKNGHQDINIFHEDITREPRRQANFAEPENGTDMNSKRSLERFEDYAKASFPLLMTDLG